MKFSLRRYLKLLLFAIYVVVFLDPMFRGIFAVGQYILGPMGFDALVYLLFGSIGLAFLLLPIPLSFTRKK